MTGANPLTRQPKPKSSAENTNGRRKPIRTANNPLQGSGNYRAGFIKRKRPWQQIQAADILYNEWPQCCHQRCVCGM